MQGQVIKLLNSFCLAGWLQRSGELRWALRLRGMGVGSGNILVMVCSLCWLGSQGMNEQNCQGQ